MSARRQALAPAAATAGVDVSLLLGELEFEDWDREAVLRERLDDGASIPAPSARRAESRNRRSRQINFRLAATSANDLDRAAALLSMTPTTLARALTMNGVRRILSENRAMLARAAHDGG